MGCHMYEYILSKSGYECSRFYMNSKAAALDIQGNAASIHSSAMAAQKSSCLEGACLVLNLFRFFRSQDPHAPESFVKYLNKWFRCDNKSAATQRTGH